MASRARSKSVQEVLGDREVVERVLASAEWWACRGRGGDAIHLAQQVAGLGQRVWAALRDGDRSSLQGRLGKATRLDVLLEDERGWELPWEAIGSAGAARQGGDRSLAAGPLDPQAMLCHWGIRRRIGAPRIARKTPWRLPRVLLLLGDLTQGLPVGAGDYGRRLQGWTPMLESAAAIVRELDAVGVRADIALSTGAGAAPEAQMLDHQKARIFPYSDRTSLMAALEGQGPFDVIFCLAHGKRVNAAASRGADALDLGFTDQGPCLLSAEADGLESLFSAWTKGMPASLIVLGACDSSAAIAPRLLQHADQMLCMGGEVEVEALGFWARGLFSGLCRGQGVDLAMRRARQALVNHERHWHQWWLPVHYTAIADDSAPFDRKRLALGRYVGGTGILPHDRHSRSSMPPTEVPLPIQLRTVDAKGVSTHERWESEALGGGLRQVLEQRPGIRLVLWGEPGAGKSTLLRQVQRAWNEEPGERHLGVYIGLQALISRNVELDLQKVAEQFVGEAWSKDLVRAWDARAWYRGIDDPGVASCQDEREVSTGPLVTFLIDGLDEVPIGPDPAGKYHRNCLDQLLTALRSQYPQASIVVASRRSAKALDRGFVDADLFPLDAGLQVQMIQRVFEDCDQRLTEPEARDFLHRVATRGGSLERLAQVPLFLTLMVRSAASSLTRELPSGNRHAFLATIARELLEQQHRHLTRATPDAANCDPDRDERFLEVLSLAMADSGNLYWSSDKVEDELETDSELQGWKLGLGHASMGAWLEAISKRSGIVIRSEGAWGFWHRSFQESFAARALLREARSRVRPVRGDARGAKDPAKASAGRLKIAVRSVLAKRIGQTLEGQLDARIGTWSEPIALLVGHVIDAVPEHGKSVAADLVKGFLNEEATFPIGLRCIATADTLEAESIGLALAKSQTWEEAAMIYDPLVGNHGRFFAARSALKMRVRELAEALRRPRFNLTDRIEVWLLIECLERARSFASSQDAEQAMEAILVSLGRPAGLERAFETVPGRPKEDLFVEIPGGEYWMGSRKDEVHRVEQEGPTERRVDAFAIARVPITVGQYRLFDPYKFARSVDSDLPATGISWFEADLFARWLQHHRDRSPAITRFGEHRVVRLPYEAEWEWACRDCLSTWVGGERPYPLFVRGDDEVQHLKPYAWYQSNAEGAVRRVATTTGGPGAPSLGLYDMLGNIWEWCLDPWERFLGSHSPVYPELGARDHWRVRRGATAMNGVAFLRPAYRYATSPDVTDRATGLRLVLGKAEHR
jgi:formylglycine-generating enzyme required for sulfatase activity